MQLSHRPDEFPGYFATILWVAIGVFLFWTTPGAAFLSWQALVYFVLGTIGAGILFGLLGQTILRLLPSLKQDKFAPQDPMAPLLGTLFGAGQMVLVYFLSKSIITGILFPAAA